MAMGFSVLGSRQPDQRLQDLLNVPQDSSACSAQRRDMLQLSPSPLLWSRADPVRAPGHSLVSVDSSSGLSSTRVSNTDSTLERGAQC